MSEEKTKRLAKRRDRDRAKRKRRYNDGTIHKRARIEEEEKYRVRNEMEL